MPKIGSTLTHYSDYIYLHTPTTDSLVLTEIPIVFPYEIKTNTPNFYHIEIVVVVVEIRYVCFFSYETNGYSYSSHSVSKF